MSSTTNTSNVSGTEKELPKAKVGLFTLVIAALVANLYYAQPLVSSIAPAIGVTPELAGSLVSVAQVGYGLGLFLLVPLADLVENRALVLLALAGAVAGLFGVASAHSIGMFFLSSFFLGLCSAVGQILMLTIAHLTPIKRRGRVVGCVMAGLLGGIMLARPVRHGAL